MRAAMVGRGNLNKMVLKVNQPSISSLTKVVTPLLQVEIYNEELRDLLGPGPPPGKKHAVRACVEGWGEGARALRAVCVRQA